MTCKLCNKNETDNTSGICWECSGKEHPDDTTTTQGDKETNQ